MTDTPTTESIERVSRTNGVGTYGLSVDYVVVDKDGRLVRQERRFLAMNMLCRYSRTNGMKRASWKGATFPTHTDARAAMLTDVAEDNSTSVMVAAPVAVELTAADVDQIKKGEMPHSRHSGVVATEKVAGKVDDENTFELPKGVWDSL